MSHAIPRPVLQACSSLHSHQHGIGNGQDPSPAAQTIPAGATQTLCDPAMQLSSACHHTVARAAMSSPQRRRSCSKLQNLLRVVTEPHFPNRETASLAKLPWQNTVLTRCTADCQQHCIQTVSHGCVPDVLESSKTVHMCSKPINVNH